MKKKIITLLAFVMLAVTTTFAGGNGISKNALVTFSGTFAKATDVKWEKEATYYKASFKMNGQSLNALLSEEGDMIAVSRNILSTELPIRLQASLNKNFSAYWIADLTEYAVGNGTVYYITLENADQKMLFESVGTYDWALVKTITK
ncbi:MAG TPA: hypothetical protein VK645_03255 [Chitinophagaceae bacterium]|nr:hypothetical protein [Chitinophagaceae bacterium]